MDQSQTIFFYFTK